MPSNIVPYIPRFITVHMGAPKSNAENVTVSFPDYIKNVASSEIYPTWEPSAIRANILAIISFALNRVYTEFYRSQGYPFDITASTAYDQKFIKGRNIFENVSQVVDDIFDNYIRKQGFVEPLSAKFCNGTTSTCDGLSQWGSQELAEQGYNSMEILHTYYGDNIELVTDAPVMNRQNSYPGVPIRLGDRGEYTVRVQSMLNLISQSYPAIPKILPVDGYFGPSTEAATKKFQQIFNLTADGVVGKSTWYKMIYLYVGLLDLTELVSQGQSISYANFNYANTVRQGDSGTRVKVLQYMLSVISEFYSNVPPVAVDGTFGPSTYQSVVAFQQMAGLPQDGVVGKDTWDAIYRVYAGITETVSAYTNVIPEALQPQADTTRPAGLIQFPGYPVTLGASD